MYGSVHVWALASGADAVECDGYPDFLFLSPDKFAVTASVTQAAPGKKVTFTLSGYKANDLRVRINGKDKGYLSFRTDENNRGSVDLTFREAGVWKVQFSGCWNPNIGREGLWSSWSDPVTVTVVREDQSLFILPEHTVSVEEEAFRGSAVEYVIINSGCRSIGNNAFRDCERLARIEIPASVTEIGTGGNNPFAGCAADLVIITPAGSAADLFAASHGIPTERP
jgi:hypothetical protein